MQMYISAILNFLNKCKCIHFRHIKISLFQFFQTLKNCQSFIVSLASIHRLNQINLYVVRAKIYYILIIACPSAFPPFPLCFNHRVPHFSHLGDVESISSSIHGKTALFQVMGDIIGRNIFALMKASYIYCSAMHLQFPN